MGLFDVFKKRNAPASDSIMVVAPVSGEVVQLCETDEPLFSSEALGKGVAIKPAENRIVAPCDGTVSLMFDTGHAVSLVSKSGAEILIHVGLETVSLKGKHYTVHVKNGDAIKAGQLLIEFDREAIAADGFDTITPVLVCNPENFSEMRTYPGKTVRAGEKIIGLKK